MKQKIAFTKMHGAGNDYIYVNTMQYPIADPEALSELWSAYHFGIGADGLVLIGSSEVADFSMRIFNADGSEAMMCGNASRCIGKYVYENGLTTKQEVALETLSGIKILKLCINGENLVESVTVDMNVPITENPKQLATPTGGMVAAPIEVAAGKFVGTYVCMGNPHCVIFVDDINSIDLPVVGPQFEHHPIFPERANIEFAQVLPGGDIRMRVWERGSGITMACGTGACATTVAAVLNNLISEQANIVMDGGTLQITWSKADKHVYMTGPATKVFDGIIEVEQN